MPVVILTFLTFFSLNATSLPILVADLSREAQMICQSSSPPSPYMTWYSGIVCGTSVRGEWLYENVVNSGLIHLLVVSGSHLVLLESILLTISHLFFRNIRPLKIGVVLILLAYVILTGWQAPALRSLFFIFLRKANQHFKFSWSPIWMTGFSVPLVLAVHSHAQFSLSLALSWMAGLALHTPLENETSFKRVALIYFYTWPILAMLSPPTPRTLLFNLLVAPALGLCLFPASLLSFICPPFASITDLLWGAFFKLVELLSPKSFFAADQLNNSMLFVVIYAVGLQLACIALRRKRAYP